MKAEELMRYDWVCLEDDNTPRQVDWIRSGEVGLFWGRTVTPPYLKPIPLTPEILEKNGFKKIQIYGKKQDYIFQCYNDEITIEVGIYDPNFILIYYHYETPDGIHDEELSSIVKVDGGKFYLHELQHALRLCEIEKEIEL